MSVMIDEDQIRRRDEKVSSFDVCTHTHTLLSLSSFEWKARF